MTRDELLDLRPEDVRGRLNAAEVVHIANTLGAFWHYDYEASKQGKVGLHALLKSGRHSDGFFVSKILLESSNIREIMAKQMVMRLSEVLLCDVDYVIGIPDGATSLGESVAKILGTKVATMEKKDGRLVLVTEIEQQSTVLFVEDFCTRGTGFRKAVLEVLSKEPTASILPFDTVILNRGGMVRVVVSDTLSCRVLPVVEKRVKDWAADTVDPCPLCVLGSTPIKPKATDENWRSITTSQL